MSTICGSIGEVEMRLYSFSENNSGGSWWLDRKQYDALIAAGWEYHATDYDIKQGHDTKPFLGETDDTVPYGWRQSMSKVFNTLQEAVEDWKRATGEDFFAEGCNCCGAPFSIASAEGEPYDYISGDSVEPATIRPW